jgi:hypothetical protein
MHNNNNYYYNYNLGTIIICRMTSNLFPCSLNGWGLCDRCQIEGDRRMRQDAAV